MDDVVAALAAEQDELIGRVADLDADALLRPSRCEGWTVADVLLHLAQTNEMAVASVEGRLQEFGATITEGVGPVADVDAFAAAVVDKERGEPEVARDRYVTSAAAQVAAFDGTDLRARVLWVAGELAARSLCTTRLSETWIHHCDVADAFGERPAPTDRLRHIARLAWRTVPYALAQAGREQHGGVAFDLRGPDGDAWAFGVEDAPATVISGDAVDLCEVAAQRADATGTSLSGTGPDAGAVLELVRTFA